MPRNQTQQPSHLLPQDAWVDTPEDEGSVILTLTPNPSIDSCLELHGALQRGAVQRLRTSDRAAGGKGINISHTLQLAGHRTHALFPAGNSDPLIPLLSAAGISFSRVDIAGAVRVNTTVTEPDGTTTKLNGPGPELSRENLLALEDMVCRWAEHASWLVLAGSLPPGPPSHWYSRLIATLRDCAPELRIAVDTSDQAMIQLGRRLDRATPDLIAPNGMELGQLLNVDGRELERAALAGDPAPAVAAACAVADRGIAEVLVTLGQAGAILVTAEGVWSAAAAPAPAVSTVGAGDAALAGYLMGRVTGLPGYDCLRNAVAYGGAAVCLPGTELPTPAHVDPSAVTVTALSQV